MVAQLKVHSPRGELVVINVCSTEEQMKSITVKRLGEIIIKELRVENSEVRMVHQGQSLQESYTLGHYEVRHMSTVQTIFILLGGTRLLWTLSWEK